jgi:hypothetical protein
MPTIIAAGDTALGNMVPATLLTGASPTTGGATTRSPRAKGSGRCQDELSRNHALDVALHPDTGAIG